MSDIRTSPGEIVGPMLLLPSRVGWETLFLPSGNEGRSLREVPVDLQDLCKIKEFRYAEIGICRVEKTVEAAGDGIVERGYC